MTSFKEQKFSIQKLDGISEKTIEEHLKLYTGYVKHANLILKETEEMLADAEKNAYALGEFQRRFSFEFNGMRNHEYYFRSLESGSKSLPKESLLKKAIEKTWGNFDGWLIRLKSIALMRGIGWAILYFDPDTQQLLTQWVDEQHLGHLNSCRYIVGIDMWEHSYMLDYSPSEKKKYIEAYFGNLNWQSAEENFKKATN